LSIVAAYDNNLGTGLVAADVSSRCFGAFFPGSERYLLRLKRKSISLTLPSTEFRYHYAFTTMPAQPHGELVEYALWFDARRHDPSLAGFLISWQFDKLACTRAVTLLSHFFSFFDQHHPNT